MVSSTQSKLSIKDRYSVVASSRVVGLIMQRSKPGKHRIYHKCLVVISPAMQATRHWGRIAFLYMP